MYDLIIIGSGPAGLTAAIYAGRASLKTLVIEKEYEGTGQIAESGKVDNYPGLPGISGYELGERFLEHARRFSVEFLNGEVIRIEPGKNKEDRIPGDVYSVRLENDSILTSKAVVYAAGSSPRNSGIPGADLFLGRGVSYCAICDGAFFKQKTLAVLGGGDTALDDALYLSDIAEKVYLIHRRAEFRGSRATQQQIANRDNIELILENQVVEITGDCKVNAIVLKDGQKVSVDGVFIAFGSTPQTGPVTELVQCDAGGYLIAGENCEVFKKDSNEILPGFYAAGDIRTKRLRQVSTAIADGANAAIAATDYLSLNFI